MIEDEGESNENNTFEILSEGGSDIADGVAEVKARIENGSPQPQPVPERLPVREIIAIPALFQARGGGDRWRSDAHINTLAAGIHRTKEAGDKPLVGTVLVYWVGDAWACLDGHHRIAAIRKWTKGGVGSTVAVEVFSGSVEAAMLAATERNSRDKLPMSERDKSERAWRLVLVSAGTHQAIAKASGVSTKTIQRMSKAIKELGSDRARMEVLRKLRWAGVRLWLDGRGHDPFAENDRDIDGWLERKIERKAEVLRKAIGTESPEIVASALMRHDRDFAREVARQLWAQNKYTAEHTPKIGDDGLPEFDDYDPADWEPDF